MLDCWPVFPCQTCWLQPYYLQSGPEKLVPWSWHLHCQILRTLLLLDLNIENSLLQHNQVKLKISTFLPFIIGHWTRKKIEYWLNIFSYLCPPTTWLGQSSPKLLLLVFALPQPRSSKLPTRLLLIISSLDKKENTNILVYILSYLCPLLYLSTLPPAERHLLVWPS